MKTTTKNLFSLSAGILLASSLMAQDYCIPPGFKSMGGSGEPFTYISNVTLEGLDNTSGMPTGNGDDNGYTYYKNATTPVLKQNGNYTLHVTANDNLGSGMMVYAWIDWNNDKTFDPIGERVMLSSPDGHHTNIVSVPKNTKDGIVRMRIYCDMPPDMGHIQAEPCGYLNHPTHPIGQHGEVEDYDIRIGSSVGISSLDYNEALNVYPNPARDILNVEHGFNEETAYYIADVYGRKISAGWLNNNKHSIDVSNLNNGQYMLVVEGTTSGAVKRFNIVN